MPGLAVIISQHPSQTDENNVRLMRQALQHETFYSSGLYSDMSLGVFIGWSCLPGSYCDGLPVKNRSGDILLFLYGEDHSDAAHNSGSARTQPTGAAASGLLELYEKHGAGFATRLNGWFHGVIVDKRRGEVLVFNDRLGMQRLYYHEESGSTLFASEAKALLKVRRSLRALAPQGVADFLACGAVLENRTLFQNIHLLPAASTWRFSSGRCVERSLYFRPEEWENQPALEEHEVEEELGRVMPRLVARYSRSPLPVAVSLTGGYDTRMIMAYLNRGQTTGTCYTFGGIYRDCFDVKIARKVAAQCGYKHRVLALDPEFFASFPALAEKTVYVSDGNLGACNAYELYLNKHARSIAPLKLTGSFGSEVMRGARAFRAKTCTPGLLRQEFVQHVDRSVETFDRVSQGHGITFSVFKHAPWYYYNRLAIEQSQVTVRTPFLDNELIALMYRARRPAIDPRELARRLIFRGNCRLAEMPTDTGNTSWWRYYIRHFLFQADYCYKSGMPQWLERVHYLCGPLQPERLLVGTHRFQHFRIWFRKQFANYVRDVVLDPRTLARPYFEPDFLRTMVARHLKGDRNYTDDLERVITLELAHRTLTDAP